MIPKIHLPDQELILSVILNRDLTTSTIHPLYLSPVVCWLNSTHIQVRRWKLKVYTVLRMLSMCIVLCTTTAHALHLYNWTSLDSIAVIWSLSVCSSLICGMHIGATCSMKRAELDKSACRAYPDLGVSRTAKVTFCTQLLLAYVCTWLYSKRQWDEIALWAPHLYEWTVFVFAWINAVGFLRLFRRI